MISLRRHGHRELSDERILGSGDFVERVIKEADESLKYEFSESELKRKVERCIEDACKKENINIKELRAGSRRRHVSQARSRIASELLEVYGIPLAQIARKVDVSTSPISKSLRKVKEY
ncbi:MAG: hypothetical protein HWN68_07480 [Desulfobacterales bacterium]|nr:hypothetical protein [Desulfobacterales bacterium]